MDKKSNNQIMAETSKVDELLKIAEDYTFKIL
jgi:hypothetical protein